MCLILHIETSTKVCSVAISRNGDLLSHHESHDEQYAHGEQLTNFIELALNKANVLISEINAVSVTSGPGSYTGLRIGVSTAKGLCYALNIPLISINSLFNLALLAKEKYPNETICTLIDARRMEVYSAIYDENLNEIKSVSADILDSFSYTQYEPFVCVGDGSNKMEPVWQDRNLIFDNSIFCSATGHASHAYQCFLENKFEDVAYFEPYYLKDFMTNNASN